MDVLVQLVDFLLKASVAYVQTAEGQKELADIEREVSDLMGDVLTADFREDVQSGREPDEVVHPNGDRFKKRGFREGK